MVKLFASDAMEVVRDGCKSGSVNGITDTGLPFYVSCYVQIGMSVVTCCFALHVLRTDLKPVGTHGWIVSAWRRMSWTGLEILLLLAYGAMIVFNALVNSVGTLQATVNAVHYLAVFLALQCPVLESYPASLYLGMAGHVFLFTALLVGGCFQWVSMLPAPQARNPDCQFVAVTAAFVCEAVVGLAIVYMFAQRIVRPRNFLRQLRFLRVLDKDNGTSYEHLTRTVSFPFRP